MAKSKDPKESKTDRLNNLDRDIRELREQLAECDRRIEELNVQYEKQSNSRSIFAKSTGKTLSEIYDEQAAISAKLRQKEVLFEAVMGEVESSSSDESRRSHDSGFSWNSGSSKSSDPATVGWYCGNCGRLNYTIFDGPDNWCGCGHQYCEAPIPIQVSNGVDRDGIETFQEITVWHCTAQWDPAPE